MLTYGYSSAADFELSIPSDGSWYWVFINNTNSTVQVTFSWRSIRPFNIMTSQNLYLATCGMLGVLGLAIISYIIRRRRSATAELQKKEEV